MLAYLIENGVEMSVEEEDQVREIFGAAPPSSG